MSPAQRCPLCGQGNACALADGAPDIQACWCFAARIDPAVLERLTPEQRDLACLCPACAGVVEAAERDRRSEQD